MNARRRGYEPFRRGTPRGAARRTGNRIFYVVAEGEGTEYDYLQHLNRLYGSDLRFLIRSPAQRHVLTPAQVVDQARVGLAEPGVSEVWGIFDHDRRPDVDRVCARANRAGIRVALSHPSFELWLLLHFQEFSAAAQGGSNRIVLEKLRAAHPAFADYGDRNKRITSDRFLALAEDDRIMTAVKRSRRLSMAVSRETPDKQDPSTGLHLLLESLGIAP